MEESRRIATALSLLLENTCEQILKTIALHVDAQMDGHDGPVLVQCHHIAPSAKDPGLSRPYVVKNVAIVLPGGVSAKL